MNFPLFIAKRIYNNGGIDNKRKVSKPAIIIAMLGITIGLAIMILSLAIAGGFKKEIRAKVIGFGSHIQIGNFSRTDSYETYPIVGNDSLMQAIATIPGISHVQRYITKPGMIKTDEDFQGIVLKGVGDEYDMEFLGSHLVDGELFTPSDTIASNQVLVSKQIADRLHLQVGDKIYTYYIQDNARARTFTIKGIYQTNLSEFDKYILITDLYTVHRLNNWEPGQVSGLEIAIDDFAKLEDCTDEVSYKVNNLIDQYGSGYYTQSIEQLYPSIFSWLEVLDTNVLVILVLMIGVAGFTMISGLLIIILERTNMIGVLKALGANDFTIRKIFLYFAVFLIGKGLVWGNVVGLFICFIQAKFHLIKLNPETYYIDTIPIQIQPLSIIILNVSVLLISLLMLIGPSYLISRIKPIQAIRYE